MGSDVARSPTSLLLKGPPTPATHSASALVSLAFRLRFSNERTGIPGSWVIFFELAVDRDPARYVALLAMTQERRCCPRVRGSHPARRCRRHLEFQYFRGLLPTAFSLARLRVARHVADPFFHPRPFLSCRKARYRPAWLALVGRDLHPQDDSPYFYEGIRTFLSYGPDLPGRTDGS